MNELRLPIAGSDGLQAETKCRTFVSEVETTNIRLSARLFYWSLIEASDLPPSRRDGSHPGTRAILEERFQADLPLPSESLAIVFAPVGDTDLVIGCGLPIERLTKELSEAPSALRLGPDSVPAPLMLESDALDADCINLLIGEHEPAAIGAIRSSQRRWTMLAAIATLLVLSLGSRWRENDAAHKTVLLREQTASSLRAVGLPATPSANDIHSERVASELSRLRSRLLATRGPAAAAALPPDAADAIAALLAVWPQEIETRANHVSINEQGIALTVEVPDQVAADVLNRSLATVRGWELQPPQAIRSGVVVQLSATLKRAATSAPNKPAPQTPKRVASEKRETK